VQQLPSLVEVPLLKSDPMDDLRVYFRDVQGKQSCDLADQWLPLDPAREQRDEGLSFPESTVRFQKLLYRELDQGSTSTSETASMMVEDALANGAPANFDFVLPVRKPAVSRARLELVDDY
jgi:hypothetical protein